MARKQFIKRTHSVITALAESIERSGLTEKRKRLTEDAIVESLNSWLDKMKEAEPDSTDFCITEEERKELPVIPPEILHFIKKYETGKPNILGHRHGEFVKYNNNIYFVLDSYCYIGMFILKCIANGDGDCLRTIYPLDSVTFDTLSDFLEIKKLRKDYTFEKFIEEAGFDKITRTEKVLYLPLPCLEEKYNSVEPISYEGILEKYKDVPEKLKVCLKYYFSNTD